MKDHQIAQLVNDLTEEIKRLNPNMPAQTRLCISRVVKKHLDKAAKTTATPPKEDTNG